MDMLWRDELRDWVGILFVGYGFILGTVLAIIYMLVAFIMKRRNR
ncbi:hypothetical protein ACFQ3N_13355 [Virgibacillus byunsanensis]|uniref:Uncharacterized protein n=1 Tax=Virgibacillus byunsanensis TaxID=570945 RepID=A0ABW3LMV4_9BACI